MVPLLWLGFDPLQSLKLAVIGASVVTIVAADRLFECFPMLPAIRRVALLALAASVLYFSTKPLRGRRERERPSVRRASGFAHLLLSDLHRHVRFGASRLGWARLSQRSVL